MKTVNLVVCMLVCKFGLVCLHVYLLCSRGREGGREGGIQKAQCDVWLGQLRVGLLSSTILRRACCTETCAVPRFSSTGRSMTLSPSDWAIPVSPSFVTHCPSPTPSTRGGTSSLVVMCVCVWGCGGVVSEGVLVCGEEISVCSEQDQNRNFKSTRIFQTCPLMM